MSMDDLYAKPGYLIRRAQQIAVAIFMDECASFDLTPVQYAAMVAIEENPEIDATRLSALVAFDRSTLGNVLERLETKGLVHRGPSKSDKRVKLLQLSPDGKALLRDSQSAVERAQARILGGLPDGDRMQLIKLLSQLVSLYDTELRSSQRNAD